MHGYRGMLCYGSSGSNIIINQDVTVGSKRFSYYYTKSLPTSVFAAGVPAKVIQKKGVKRLSTERKHIIALEIMSDFREYALHYLKLKNVVIKGSHSFAISFRSKRLIYTLEIQKC